MRLTKEDCTFTKTEYKILRAIENHGDKGTLELARLVDLAPKNLIPYLKRFELKGLIDVKTQPVKPKGRKRVFTISEIGKTALDIYEDYQNALESIKLMLK